MSTSHTWTPPPDPPALPEDPTEEDIQRVLAYLSEHVAPVVADLLADGYTVEELCEALGIEPPSN